MKKAQAKRTKVMKINEEDMEDAAYSEYFEKIRESVRNLGDAFDSSYGKFFNGVQSKSFGVSQDRSFSKFQDKPFGFAQGKPFGMVQGKFSNKFQNKGGVKGGRSKQTK